MSDLTLSEDLMVLEELRRIEGEAKEAHQIAERERKAHEARTYERMEREHTDSQRVNGILWKPQSTVYATIQDRAEFVAWAEEHAVETLVEQKERKGELSKFVREKLDNGEALPPGVGFYTREYISRHTS